MTNRKNSDRLATHQDGATDKRTLDEIEEAEEVSTGSESPTPSPDEGVGRSPDDDAGAAL